MERAGDVDCESKQVRVLSIGVGVIQTSLGDAGALLFARLSFIESVLYCSLFRWGEAREVWVFYSDRIHFLEKGLRRLAALTLLGKMKCHRNSS